MEITHSKVKKPSETTSEVQHIEQASVLVHEMRTTGCQAIGIIGQSEVNPSTTVTDFKREPRRVIGQHSGDLANLRGDE